ncbi:MAG: hypothetical protein K5790_10510 [Nitrosopumilus sp.]|uniref:hypothetical protein n=1 Tax=Nitrosopumilus sp. TaxID=2024843 RepID=UPI00247D26F8|nr:hypothetical protein [Nitrosopumilus sp.]MCV0393702.1 hypothetical protein [Nitrosopumilus sp.]
MFDRITLFWFVISITTILWFINTTTRHGLGIFDIVMFFVIFGMVMVILISMIEKERLIRKLNDPQIIVYIGLLLLAIGIIICAIDPLKPIEQTEPLIERLDHNLFKITELDGNIGYWYVDRCGFEFEEKGNIITKTYRCHLEEFK